MARTGKTGTRKETEMRTSTGVSEEAKQIVSAIVDRITVALDSSISNVARLLTKSTPYPDKKLDSKIGGLIKGTYTQAPWKDTIVEIASLIPDPVNPSKTISPGELWEIFAGLRDYRAEFIYPDDFEISAGTFDFAVQSFAAKKLHGGKSTRLEEVEHVDVNLKVFAQLMDRELADRDVPLDDFARSIGFSPKNLEKMLSGDPKVSTLENFARLATHLIDPRTKDRFLNADALTEYLDGKA